MAYAPMNFPSWYPTPKVGRRPARIDQRVVGFIGCPGSGKSTLAASYDPMGGWVTITLDDLRQTLWPPHRRIYWDVRGSGDPDIGARAQALLHTVNQAALHAALYEGFNVVLPDTHIRPSAFLRDLQIVAEHGITIEWKLFKVPLEELIARNHRRGEIDLAHRVPDGVLTEFHRDLWSEDAWWRELPQHLIEIIDQTPAEAA